MLKVEIFNETDLSRLKKDVNLFLSKNPNITVLSMTQSEAGEFQKHWAVTLTILYRENP